MVYPYKGFDANNKNKNLGSVQLIQFFDKLLTNKQIYMNGKKNVHPGTKQVQCLKEMRKKLP